MVQVVKSIIFLLVMMILNGCSTNEPYVTTHRFDKISKDAVLDASKQVFQEKDSDILIDSYRDKMKAIDINSAFYGINGLSVYEYTIEVKQDENGTIAQLSITDEDGLDQEKSYVEFDYIHNFIWDDIEDVLNENIPLKYIDQKGEYIKQNKEVITQKLKEVNISIQPANSEQVLNFDEDIVSLEDVEDTPILEENGETQEEVQKDDFEKKLDAIVNSNNEIESIEGEE